MSLRTLLELTASALLALWICIDGYNAILGRASFSALRARQAAHEELRAETEALAARRASLERRADMLNRRGVDLDLLEERTRAVLGYAREGERVITREQLDRLLQDE